MHKKLSIPLIISIIIMTLSIFLYINIYNRWQDKDIHISNPIINNIDSHSQKVYLKTIIHETETHVIQIDGQNEDLTITRSEFIYNDKVDIITNFDTHSQTVDLKTIIHETEKHVVQIEGQNEESTITRSGFLYNDQGDIITNAHVIEDANVIYVRTSNAHIYSAAVIGIGENT